MSVIDELKKHLKENLISLTTTKNQERQDSKVEAYYLGRIRECDEFKKLIEELEAKEQK